jgi:WD repeat-containing protein 90
LGKFLCTVGIDNQRRESILIWNVSEIESKKKPDLIAKQISEFDIVSMKFSPIEADHLVSCGRENIRFWRIKSDHLKGGAVVLNHHARNTVFTGI